MALSLVTTLLKLLVVFTLASLVENAGARALFADAPPDWLGFQSGCAVVRSLANRFVRSTGTLWKLSL